MIKAIIIEDEITVLKTFETKVIRKINRIVLEILMALVKEDSFNFLEQIGESGFIRAFRRQTNYNMDLLKIMEKISHICVPLESNLVLKI